MTAKKLDFFWVRSLSGGALWASAGLAVNESILIWRRVRIILGVWFCGGTRDFGRSSKLSAPLEVIIARLGEGLRQISLSLGVTEQAFSKFSLKQTPVCRPVCGEPWG